MSQMRHWRLWFLLAAVACASNPATTGTGAGAAGTPSPSTTDPRAEKRDNAVLYGAVSRARYALESRDSLAMEMPDGSFQRQLTEKTSYLTISLAPAGAGFTVAIQLDSMKLTYADRLMQQLVDSAAGTSWQGTIEANGRVNSLEPSKPSVFGEQVRTSLRRLLPVLPSSGAKPGDQWTDSSTMALAIVAGMNVQEHRSTQYRAQKFDNQSGRRVLVVNSATTYQVQGSGTSYGQELTIAGTGTATGTHSVSVDGRLIEASVGDSVGMTITVPAVGQTVPTVVTSRYTLRLLP